MRRLGLRAYCMVPRFMYPQQRHSGRGFSHNSCFGICAVTSAGGGISGQDSCPLYTAFDTRHSPDIPEIVSGEGTEQPRV